MKADHLTEQEAIRQTALNYIQGWYEGDVERMRSSLHPDLAKRVIRPVPSMERSVLDHMSADRLVEVTRAGFGKDTPLEERRSEVTILDIFENAASVRVDAAEWVDYLHVGKVNGEWKIINVLWEMRPGTKPH